MSNDGGRFDAARALRILGKACADAASHHDGDMAHTFSSLEKQLQGLSPNERAEVEKALRKMLEFQPPPSRSQH